MLRSPFVFNRFSISLLPVIAEQQKEWMNNRNFINIEGNFIEEVYKRPWHTTVK